MSEQNIQHKARRRQDMEGACHGVEVETVRIGRGSGNGTIKDFDAALRQTLARKGDRVISFFCRRKKPGPVQPIISPAPAVRPMRRRKLFFTNHSDLWAQL